MSLLGWIFRNKKNSNNRVASIGIAPEITPAVQKMIEEKWEKPFASRMPNYTTKKFADEEIRALRKLIKKSYFAGERCESFLDQIQEKYDLSSEEGEHLARQETRILAVYYQAAKYIEAGFTEYLWRCVRGTVKHPTRKRHQELSAMSDKGITFRWDDPPITSELEEPERRNHPGLDDGCRCDAIPTMKPRK